jgi:hypothetical protein
MRQEPYTAVHMPMVTMSFYKNTTVTGMQDDFHPLKYGTLNMWGRLKFTRGTEPDHDKLDHFQWDHVEPNQGLHHQIIMIYAIFLNTMQRRVVITNVPSSIDNKSKRGIRTWVKLTDTTHFFFGLCPWSNFLKKHILEAGYVSVFKDRNT